MGTGVLTLPVYRNLPRADVTCLDYSAEMMATAQKRAKLLGLKNVRFLRGDVGALPFADGSFDVVLSLNGFHAFSGQGGCVPKSIGAGTRRNLLSAAVYIWDERPAQTADPPLLRAEGASSPCPTKRYKA